MAVSNTDLSWLETRMIFAVQDINTESRMSLQVKGLAATVRQAKAAISKADDAALRVNRSAAQLTDTLGQVEDMATQLDAANAELQAAVGELSNGGPPLDASPEQSAGSASQVTPSRR